MVTDVPFQRISRSVPVCGRILVITAGLRGPSQVWVIKDGVALNPCEEDLGVPGCLALVTGQGLCADLSGFQVIQDDAYRQVLDVLRLELKEMLGEVLDNLNKLRVARRMHPALCLVHPFMFLVVFGEMFMNSLHRGPLEKALRSRIQKIVTGS